MTFDLYWENKRLKTFKKWPFGKRSKCNPKKMAEAGFYACGGKGEEDLAKCYFCGKELTGWERNDDPWEEHRKHPKPCKFLDAGKTEKQMTVSEHVKLMGEVALREIDNHSSRKFAVASDQLNELLSSFIPPKQTRK